MASSLPAENVLALAVDDRGVLWVGTTSGLARWTGAGFDRLPGARLSGEIVVSLSAEAGGGLWIGTNRGLDLRRADGRIEQPAWRTQFRHANVVSVLRDRVGARWISTQQGLVREHAGRIELFAGSPAFGKTLNMALEDNQGGLWFATADSGLLRLPADWRHFSVFRGGTAEGQLRAAPVRGSALARDGRIWLAGGIGLLDRLDPRTGRVDHPLDLSRELPNARLWSVLERGDGSVWIGHSEGLSRFQPGTERWRHWRIGEGEDALLPGPVRLLADGADGLLWLASYGGGLQARDGEGRIVHSFRPEDGHGVDSPEQEQLSAGPDGALWLAGPKGLRRWNAGASEFERISGAPDGQVYGFAFAAPDTLWLHRMGALEKYRLRGRAMTLLATVDAEDGLPAVESGGLMLDQSGVVWLTTARGLMRYDPIGRRLRVYGVRDGLPGQEFQALAPLSLPLGLALASSKEGLVLFDPARIRPATAASSLVLDAVSLRRDEDEVALPLDGSALSMGPQDRDLRIKARLLSFTDPSAHRYRFRLSNYDADWVEAGASGERVFSRLEPGNYRLQVAASNADGAWSPPRGFALQVLAPWWRRPWALALWAGVALSFSALAARGYRQRVRDRHAETLREQRRQLSDQGSEAKTRFLATLGHEIRTPMTGVLGMAELLQGGMLEPRQRQQVQAIQRAGEHLLRLVNDALDLARIEAGKLTLEDAPFDLHELLDEVAALLQPLAQQRRLAFALQRAPGTPRVLRGDAGRLRQILLNLGSNAIKFTEQGEVVLRCELGADSTPAGVVLEVADTGEGMDAAQLSRLFRRFEQADGLSDAQRRNGSGLGLAICQELAQAMDGRIDVQSQLGQGTCFRVHLPLPLAELAPSTRPMPRQTPRDVDGKHVLVVEDDATVAEVVVGLLQALGYQTVHAPHALAALSELAQQRFDLALLDLDLPGLDGFELARIVRGQAPATMLIALTARADAQAEPEARAAGMHGFLRKPLTSQLLSDAIEGVFAERRELSPEPSG
jgi:signal transduction histidine kinase/ActR/RegA family two-component response regulator/streptogramin lyase